MIDLDAGQESQSDSEADSDSSYPSSCLNDTSDSSDYDYSSDEGSSEVDNGDNEDLVVQIGQDEVLEIFIGTHV